MARPSLQDRLIRQANLRQPYAWRVEQFNAWLRGVYATGRKPKASIARKVTYLLGMTR